MDEERFSRQLSLFGEDGQRRIKETRVGVIGLGGIGSQVVQALAYLGVVQLVLVDDDVVEISNLNRLVGATLSDAEKKTKKVLVAERVIKAITPHAQIELLPFNLRSEQAIDTLVTCNFLFGCVDTDGARLILTELAAAYEIPLIDCATEIIPEDQELKDFGGRIIVARPGDFCAICANQIDMEVAKIELESPAERKFREQHGYGLGQQQPAPAVISINGIIANLAVTEFIMLVTGSREPNRFLIYRGMRGVVNASTDKKKDNCYICGTVVGSREKTNLKRYTRI